MSEQTSVPPQGATRAGFVALIGAPNAGKSTLLNQLIGQKLAIVTHKAQTTRTRIRGITMEGASQLVFVDTPGIHQKAHKAINRYMNQSALAMLHDVNVVLWLLEGTRWLDDDEWVLQQIKAIKTPIILVVNKIDKVKDKSDLLPFLEKLQAQVEFHQVVPISAKNGYQVDVLWRTLAETLPEGPHGYEDDEVTDRSLRFLAAEVIREKAMRQLGEEVPYELTVEVESWKQEGEVTHIHALILVDKPSQKGIVIGKGGRRLKAIGRDARLDIEKLVDGKVMLNVWVKVKSGWSDDERALQSLGYD